ncbi:hypothetical protein [Bacillus sp. NPDC093026]|uniref:hypothetical protein n=1 Tax=Bacillus sp. NPDC093026 TaxID=3363948 RepID=UPI0037F1AC35
MESGVRWVQQKLNKHAEQTWDTLKEVSENSTTFRLKERVLIEMEDQKEQWIFLNDELVKKRNNSKII